MEKDKSTVIYPGTIFTAKNYDPFTKKVLSHPFVCVYDQALDNDLADAETNILALLITSNNKQYSRQVPILKAKNSFLEKDSFCYCNNIYMFLKSDVNVIGQMDTDTFFEVVKKRQMLLRGENDQCVQALMNMKAYEYKLKQKEKEKQKEEEKHKEEEKQKAETHRFHQPPHNIDKKQYIQAGPLDIDSLNKTNSTPLINPTNKPSENNNPQPLKKKHFFSRKKRGESPTGGLINNTNNKQ